MPPRRTVRGVLPLALARALVLAAAAVWTGGCQSTQKSAGRYEVQVPRVALYRHGPAQGTGPDVSLSQGDQVTVLESAKGYSRVTLANGDSGYVKSESLRPLPAAAIARPAATANVRRSSPERSVARFAPNAEPLFDIGDLPAPESAAATPVAVPRFRLPR